MVGTFIDPLVELDGVELEFRFLTRDGMSVELLHFVSPDPVGPSERRPMNQFGLTHFGLAITELDAVARTIVEYGGQVYPAHPGVLPGRREFTPDRLRVLHRP